MTPALAFKTRSSAEIALAAFINAVISAVMATKGCAMAARREKLMMIDDAPLFSADTALAGPTHSPALPPHFAFPPGASPRN